MTRVALDITMSLDGYVAGPNPTVEAPLGTGGEQLHEWIVGLASWRERHGEAGGERTADDDIVRESVAATGAYVMGRHMFSGGDGPWEDDPVAAGCWGDEPPFGVPVFVVTHHERQTLTKEGGTSFVFVTDGVEAAVDLARAAAGDKNVTVAGGADVARQCLGARLLDEIQIHFAPILLGGGRRLFDDLGGDAPPLQISRVVDSPAVTDLRYSVVT
jgi:dihydrofolate reductase